MRETQVVLPVVVAHPELIAAPGALQIAVHLLGAVAILGLWARLGPSSHLLTVATMFGVLWMSVDIIAIAITYHVVPALAIDHAAGIAMAGPLFGRTTVLVDAVRLGAHLAGGLWMIGFSVFAVRAGTVPVVVAWLGIGVGAIFGANLFLPALLNVSFLTVPTWLVILGVAIARVRMTIPDALPRAAAA